MQAGGAGSSQPARQQRPQERLLFEGKPSLLGMCGSVVKALLVIGAAVLLVRWPVERPVSDLLNLGLTDSRMLVVAEYRLVAGAGLVILAVLLLALKMVALRMTNYEVTSDRIEWSRGILDRKVDNIDMFRVIDLKLRRSVLDCIFGIGRVELITTDKTDPEFTFEKVRHSRRLYDVIKKAGLEADRRDSVVHVE